LCLAFVVLLFFCVLPVLRGQYIPMGLPNG